MLIKKKKKVQFSDGMTDDIPQHDDAEKGFEIMEDYDDLNGDGNTATIDDDRGDKEEIAKLSHATSTRL